MTESLSFSSKVLSSASTRIHTLKEYLKPPGPQSSWRAWAGQKIRMQGGYDGTNLGMESLSLFPGWAVRKQRKDGELEACDIEVFVSGYAVFQRPPDAITRSQRAFIRIAKGFASLPKISTDFEIDHRPSQLPSSAEGELIQVKRRSRNNEDDDVQDLERCFQDANTVLPPSSTYSTRSRSPSPEFHPRSLSPSPSSSTLMTRSSIDIQKFHDNLVQRLRPFWSSALSERTVHITLSANKSDNAAESKTVVTSDDGSFQARFTVPWEKLFHPSIDPHIDHKQEHELFISAKLDPPPPSATTSDHTVNTTSAKFLPHDDFDRQQQTAVVPEKISISITHSPLRLISDIDDTVKMSGILSGARVVFFNVFMRDLQECVIPGMGDWYRKMWEQGVRFHYVSNGPFELFPLLKDFLHISKLPQGSIKLKSYAGRSILNGLISAPAARKRAGVIDILTSFPDSQFVLVGDSGEQDLELYSELAAEYPQQVVAVLIRDAGQEEESEPLEDPTGAWMSDEQLQIQRLPSESVNNRKGNHRGRICSAYFTPSIKPSSGGRQEIAEEPGQVKEDKGKCPLIQSSKAAREGSLAQSSGRDLLNEEGTRQVRSDLSTHSSGSGVGSSGSSWMTITTETTSIQDPLNQNSTWRRRSMMAGRPSLSVSLSESDKRRQTLQGRVHEARARMPRDVRLRLFRDPRECVEVEEILALRSHSKPG